MKLLCDQDVYGVTVRFLRSSGHDVVTAADLGLPQAADSELLAAAKSQGRILTTRDRDFGGLVFVQHSLGGVIYLRMSPSVTASVHAELHRVLTLYGEPELATSFVVVEPGRHRIRRNPSS